MFKKIIHFLFKDLFILVAAYQNNVFPDPLEKEEEEKLIALMLKGDQNARNKLIEHNLRLVAHIVKKYEHTKDDADDLISIGVIGLIKGVDSYSYKHGTRITTYCARCIENEILMFFRNSKKLNSEVFLNEPIGKEIDFLCQEMNREINTMASIRCSFRPLLRMYAVIPIVQTWLSPE